jgi:hypothetical protein
MTPTKNAAPARTDAAIDGPSPTVSQTCRTQSTGLLDTYRAHALLAVRRDRAERRLAGLVLADPLLALDAEGEGVQPGDLWERDNRTLYMAAALAAPWGKLAAVDLADKGLRALHFASPTRAELERLARGFTSRQDVQIAARELIRISVIQCTAADLERRVRELLEAELGNDLHAEPRITSKVGRAA